MGKFKDFIKKLFSRNKILKIEQKTGNKQIKEKNNIRDSLRIDDKRLELINLQEKFENDELDLYNMPKQQLQALILLYEEQVNDLNRKLNTLQ